MPSADVITHRVAVVGASGFIGQAIVSEAKRQAVEFSALSAPRLMQRSPESLDASPPQVDDLIVQDLALRLKGHDVVINAAGLSDSGSDQYEALFGANSLLPLVIAKAAALAGCRRMVHISSAAVQGRASLDETTRMEPFSPYSSSKALGESWLRHIDDIEIAILRPTSVHGASRKVTQQVIRLASGPLSSIAGGSARTTPQTHCRTVARSALFLALHNDSVPSISLTPDEGLTTESFLEILGNRKPVRVPRALARIAVRTLVLLGSKSARATAYSRRLEMLWFGQERPPGWLAQHDLVVPRSAWSALPREITVQPLRPKVLFGVTSGLSVRGFFNGQHKYLRSQGWDVYLTCANEGDAGDFAESEGSTYIPLRATRNPSPLRDLATTLYLVRILLRLRPDVAVWGSPKVGLLGPVASWLTRTPSVYVIHGLRLETTSDVQRKILVLAEKVACWCATSVVVVGRELREAVVDLKIVPAAKATVLANGSANGVSEPDLMPSNVEKKVVGYVGRITHDKGLTDLVKAWPSVVRAHPDAHLQLVGAVEADAGSKALAERLSALPQTQLLGHVDDLDHVYRGLYCLVLPSYREGLPNVVLEASSFGVACLATDATGASEPIIDRLTGLVFPMRNPLRLVESLSCLLADSNIRNVMGANARNHVLKTYGRLNLWRAWNDHLRLVASNRSGGIEYV